MGRTLCVIASCATNRQRGPAELRLHTSPPQDDVSEESRPYVAAVVNVGAYSPRPVFS